MRQIAFIDLSLRKVSGYDFYIRRQLQLGRCLSAVRPGVITGPGSITKDFALQGLSCRAEQYPLIPLAEAAVVADHCRRDDWSRNEHSTQQAVRTLQEPHREILNHPFSDGAGNRIAGG